MSFPETFPWIFDIWLTAIEYVIEVHNSDGDLLAILENAHSISYTEATQEAPTLSFSIPADDTKETNLIKANEIWIRKYSDNTIANKFRLARRGDERS